MQQIGKAKFAPAVVLLPYRQRRLQRKAVLLETSLAVAEQSAVEALGSGFVPERRGIKILVGGFL